MNDIEEIHFMLCTSGYLPPRNEYELYETEKHNTSYKLRNSDRRVDVEKIIKKSCSCSISYMHADDSSMVTEPIRRAAARNLESLPQNIIKKIKSQHSSKNDEDK
ncbi:hypothetical protein prwr041_16390 [Prevotella herbatica]|uniref:Uncharacterized protein n=1 Tax=Prevotella herbatica TaxID=2801997 RepID=A0ABM7NZ54_9BACT|nr:hypothetical protein [Prevotella herbatica]BCS85746.1 hypothetical protein prwr041_16390 [Prevotella herbatica]